METIKRVLITLVKGYFLLIGIAMLVGGGLCSVAIPFMNFSKETAVLTGTILIAVMILGALIFLTLKQSFFEHLKSLALAAGGFFLVGGGLCATIKLPSEQTAVVGFLLLNIALALSGYILVRWMIDRLKSK